MQADMSKLHPDAAVIASLGGSAKLAERLRYDKKAGGIQRVQNWMTRGIPAAVKVQFPELFLRAATTSETEEPPFTPDRHPNRRASDRLAQAGES
jgi:hypothetical protein